MCDRDRCLSDQFKCDGRVDCRDGTDEANCGMLAVFVVIDLLCQSAELILCQFHCKSLIPALIFT